MAQHWGACILIRALFANRPALWTCTSRFTFDCHECRGQGYLSAGAQARSLPNNQQRARLWRPSPMALKSHWFLTPKTGPPKHPNAHCSAVRLSVRAALSTRPKSGIATPAHLACPMPIQVALLVGFLALTCDPGLSPASGLWSLPLPASKLALPCGPG